MKFRITLLLAVVLSLVQILPAPAQNPESRASDRAPFIWENANVYFLLTDRFANGDTTNDVNFGRTEQAAPLRGFMGGDLKGITQKIRDGYFDKLGVTAIWFSPVVEQIHGATDEGTGKTYGFHGYWAKDWTRLEPNFGSLQDLANLVQTAHEHGIRIILDVVANHTGPVTDKDPVWPDNWVRTGPPCAFKGYVSTVECTLVENLPDIRTGRDKAVDLPAMLVKKWEAEGRLQQEQAELEAFFERTGYPRAPRFYLIKWLTDYIREFGIDGYRLDTAKHTQAYVWSELRREADKAFKAWKKQHPEQVLDTTSFFMTGEVYGYGIQGGRYFNYGDKKVDFYSHGIDNLINFSFKGDANKSYQQLFSQYSDILNGKLDGYGVLNYLDSHDDGSPFDRQRKHPFEAGTKLLLAPGASQIYYGDETIRSLTPPKAQGDATLRSFMNWDELAHNAERNGYKIEQVLEHYQKLGRFRRAHPAVGAGVHKMISRSPYTFARTYQHGNYSDTIVAGLDMDKGRNALDVEGYFDDGSRLKDYYSGKAITVVNGQAVVDSEFGIVLLGR